MTRVVIATTGRNEKDQVIQCLRSLHALKDADVEIIFIDRSSGDGTCEKIGEIFPFVTILKQRDSEILGQDEALNDQIRYAFYLDAAYLLTVDCRFTADPLLLKNFMRALESDSKMAFAFPRIDASGDSVPAFPQALFHEAGQDPGKWGCQDFENKKDSPEMPYACLVRMAAVQKIGYLEAHYFADYSITEWLLRFRSAGFEGRYVPEARVSWLPHDNFSPVERLYYRTRGHLFFLKKYLPPLSFFFLFLSFFLGFPLKKSKDRGKSNAGILAALDFLRNKRGERNFKIQSRTWKQLLQKAKAPLPAFFKKGRYFFKRFFSSSFSIGVHVQWRIGDEIVITPVYEALKKKYPRARVWAEVNHPELLQGNPFVEGTSFSMEKTDFQIDLHREIRSRPRRDYLAEFAGVKSWGLPRIYLKSGELEAAQKKWAFKRTGPHIAVAPYPLWFSRRWPLSQWAALVEFFIQTYDAQVFVLGKGERPLPAGVDLIGRTSLREAAAIIAQSDLFVGTDSGLLHMALAVGASSVGLFGPLDPSLLTESRPGYIPVWTELECRGCWPDGRMKARDCCPKTKPDCMTSISLEKVIASCEELLMEKRRL